MAKIGRRRLAREVVRLLNEQPGNRARIVQQVAAYLVEHKQTKQLDLLMRDIADEQYVQHKQLSADVQHAFNLSPQTTTAITNLLKNVTGATSVELQTSLQPDLLGGVIVRTPRQELDASVRRKLKALVAEGTN